jgi:hypothetical protein
MTLRTLAWLTLLACLALPGATRADACPGTSKHCPKPSYSCLHWWVPQLYRCAYRHHVPRGLYDVEDRYPHLPPTFVICPYPCPPVEPAQRCSPHLAPPASAPQ